MKRGRAAGEGVFYALRPFLFDNHVESTEMSHVGHRVARRAGEDEAAGLELKLGEFDTAGCLVISEVKILLEKREKMADTPVYKKTLDYVTQFARFGSEDSCAAVRKALQKDTTLKQFEIAQLANLCPNDAEEAKALIPSLTTREDDALQLQLNELASLRRFQ